MNTAACIHKPMLFCYVHVCSSLQLSGRWKRRLILNQLAHFYSVNKPHIKLKSVRDGISYDIIS